MQTSFIHTTSWLAQNNGNDAAAASAFLAAFGFVICGGFLVGLAIQCALCWFLSSCLKALPEEHRKQQPGMVWLMLIPLFNIVWSFFVYPRIADSFKSYFDSIGRLDVGDCGRGLAIAFCIIVCCCLIPYLNFCIVWVSLIVLIILLVKFGSLKGQVGKGGGFSVTPVPPV